MAVWDEVKDILGRIKLVEIKNEVHMHGDINMPFKGDTIHQSVTHEEQIKISSTEVTPDLEREYHRKFYEFVRAREAYFSSLPADQRKKEIAKTSIASAVTAMTTTTTTQPPQAFGGTEGEDASNIQIVSDLPKKPFGSDDSGETM